MLLKIKISILQLNNGRYNKILKSKIVHLKETYKFCFDYFLIKRTVFVLIVKNVIKNLLASLAHSLRAQLASFARMSARPNGRRASRSDVYELRATRSVLRAS